MAESDTNPLDGTEELNGDRLRDSLESTDYTVNELEDHLERHADDYSARDLQVFREVEREGSGRKGATAAIEQHLESAEAQDAEQSRAADLATNADVEEAEDGPALDAPDAAHEAATASAGGDEPVGPDDEPAPASTAEPTGPDAHTVADSGSQAQAQAQEQAQAQSEDEHRVAAGPEVGITPSGSVNLERLDTPEGEADLTSDDVDVGVLPDPYNDASPETLTIVVPQRMMFAGEFYEEAGTYEVPYREPNGQDHSGMRLKRSLETDTNPVRLSESDPLHPNYDEDDDGPAGTPA